MTITVTSPLTTWLFERFTAFWEHFHAPEGYVFRLEVDEDTIRRFRFLYLAYLRRNPNRYRTGALTEIPEFGPLLEAMPRAELCEFTLYVVARLAEPRDRFDYQRYAVDYRLLEQLLALRPWADEHGMRRIAEALFFLSPFGYAGVLYWPLGTYLGAVIASCGGRSAPDSMHRILELIDDELRRHFSLGFTAEVAHCQLLLQGLLWPVAGGLGKLRGRRKLAVA